jgi:hypothetical protein
VSDGHCHVRSHGSVSSIDNVGMIVQGQEAADAFGLEAAPAPALAPTPTPAPATTEAPALSSPPAAKSGGTHHMILVTLVDDVCGAVQTCRCGFFAIPDDPVTAHSCALPECT